MDSNEETKVDSSDKPKKGSKSKIARKLEALDKIPETEMLPEVIPYVREYREELRRELGREEPEGHSAVKPFDF